MTDGKIFLVSTSKRNGVMRVLFLDLDTLRPDHLGCYGYGRNTSPNIDSIAEKGVRFNNYYCSDAPCLPSRSSLMSGKFGIHTGVVGHGGTTADRRLDGENRGFRDSMYEESLTSVFRKAGLKTISISPFAERHAAYWFNAGFNETYNTGKRGGESAELVTPTVLKWLDDNAEEDWFLHVNYWDAHAPYRAPAEYGNPFEDEPIPEWLTQQVLDKHKKMVGPHCCHELGMYDNFTWPQHKRSLGEILNMDDMRKFIDGYDCGISYMDMHIGMIIDKLKQKNIFEDMMIIISSDHGENLGELGIYSEHATADYNTCRIPMIISFPGCEKGHVDDGLHYNLDLAPTVSDLLDIRPCDNWDGQSYAETLYGGKDTGRDFLVLSQCAHVLQRSVRHGDYIYIRSYHDGYHLFPDEMLFDVKNDPHETENLADTREDVCGKCSRLLDSWHGDMMKTSSSDIDPLWTVYKEGGPHHCKGYLKEYFNYLSKTDRGWAIERLKQKHPNEF